MDLWTRHPCVSVKQSHRDVYSAAFVKGRQWHNWPPPGEKRPAPTRAAAQGPDAPALAHVVFVAARAAPGELDPPAARSYAGALRACLAGSPLAQGAPQVAPSHSAELEAEEACAPAAGGPRRPMQGAGAQAVLQRTCAVKFSCAWL